MKPQRVGITGGIGSGKSVVCRLFALWGVPIYDSDSRAKELMAGPLAGQIVDLLGPEAFSNGTLNRKYIASKVFVDADLLARLNAIVHPAVRSDFEQWAADKVDSDYVIIESAILFSGGISEKVDRTVAVTAPDEVRISRVAARDGSSPQQVRARIANQRDESAAAEFIIENDGQRSLVEQVARLHKIFVNGA